MSISLQITCFSIHTDIHQLFVLIQIPPTVDKYYDDHKYISKSQQYPQYYSKFQPSFFCPNSDGPILQFWWRLIPQVIMCILDCLLVSAICCSAVQCRLFDVMLNTCMSLSLYLCLSGHSVFLAAGNKFARGYMFYRRFFFFLANRPTYDQTADRRRVKSIPVLRTYVWHE